ncbi:hypothetical protein E0K89_014180 [Aquicoccus sp. SCR17]|nr:hypothetical protein [Carideicomes alvinocaridis]
MKRLLASALVTVAFAGAAAAATGPDFDFGRDQATSPEVYTTTGQTLKVDAADYLAPQDQALTTSDEVTVTVFKTEASDDEPAWSKR